MTKVLSVVKRHRILLIHKGEYLAHAACYTALFIDAHHAYVMMAGPVAMFAVVQLFLTPGE